MIECQVTQGCEVGITVRRNGKNGHSEIVLFLFAL